MKLTKLAMVVLLGVMLVGGLSTTGCSSQSIQEPECQLTNQEAIALAQQYFNDAIAEIPCSSGRIELLAFLERAGREWQASAPLFASANYKTVTYQTPGSDNSFTWRVYCDSKIVSPVGDTWEYLQAFIAVASINCD